MNDNQNNLTQFDLDSLLSAMLPDPKPEPFEPETMTRLDAIQVMTHINLAIKNGDIKRYFHLLGITDELAEEMTQREIMDSVQVRMSRLAVRAGINPENLTWHEL